ncbi:hypothetical protein HWV62_16266 [Athelia sp. TMB]|nr:hypothetical protein HWV62_16266 [Athelia sp. TMB]
MTSTSPRIAIIGAGLGGLSLLTHLQRYSISATLYEKDESFDARSHIGGILDMHYESGQRALNEAKIEWRHLTRPESEEMRIYDSQGTLLLEDDGKHGPPGTPGAGDEQSRPEIDRTPLRKLFYDYVAPSNSIKWSHNFTSARCLPDSTYELTFADGATATCDLLVGADGAWSRVRPLVSPAKPAFSGITGVETSLAPARLAAPELQDVAAHVGQGTCFSSKGGDALVSQRAGDGRIRTYVWFRAPEASVLPTDDVPATRAVLLARFAGWAPWQRRLISECDPAAVYPRPLYSLPVGHKWESQRGVTLIGDAAHLMLPSGKGANLALLDGLELALALAGARESGQGWQEAVQAFESEMCTRAGECAAEAVEISSLFFGDGAPQAAVDFFKSHMPPPE